MIASARAIPRPRELSAAQVRGFACVWCATEIGDDAVDLPSQPFRILDMVTRWYPRACLTCTEGVS